MGSHYDSPNTKSMAWLQIEHLIILLLLLLYQGYGPKVLHAWVYEAVSSGCFSRAEAVEMTGLAWTEAVFIVVLLPHVETSV